MVTVPPLDLGFLSLISSGIAATGPLWEPLVRLADGAVVDELLLSSERYEVWLRCWAAGTTGGLTTDGDGSTPNANVAFTVVRGSLVTHDATGGQGELVQVGDTRSIGAGQSHELANLDCEPAVSIHVQSAVPALAPRSELAFVAGARRSPRLPESVAGYAAHPARPRLAG